MQAENHDIDINEEWFDSLIDSLANNTSIADSRMIFDIVEDPLLSPDIADDVIRNLRLTELNKRPKTNYMEKVQKHIIPITRARFVDFLIGAAQKLSYSPETLHLAVNYLDRYMSGNTIVHYAHMKLVGLTCMMIASKYEEVQAGDFDFDAYLRLARKAFRRQDFIRMERTILSYLDYEVTVVTTWSFLERYVRVAHLGGKSGYTIESLEYMATYLAEVSLLSYSMLRYVPSLIAASSVFLAQYILDPSKRPWNATLQHYTAYEPSDLRDCVLALHSFCYKSSSSDMPEIKNKFSSIKYYCVALKSSPPSIPPQVFKNSL